MSQLALSVTFQLGYTQESRGMIQADNGDYVLVGLIFDQHGQSQAFAIRYNPHRSPAIWQRTYPESFSTSFESVAQIADGTFIAVGTKFRSNDAGDEALWIVNLDPQGNLIWQTTYGQQGVQTDGFAVMATSDGFVVAGDTSGHGKSSGVVLKYSGQRLVWEKNFDKGTCFAISATQDGGFILAGASSTKDALNFNPYVLRLAANGSTVWERVYSQIEIYELGMSGVIETIGGFIAVAGGSGNGAVLGIDPDGNLVWSHRTSHLRLRSILELPKGTYAVGGSQVLGSMDYAYVANLGAPSFEDMPILWDNTECLSPSILTALLVNRDGLVAGFGYLPWIDQRSQLVLAIFYPARQIPSAETNP